MYERETQNTLSVGKTRLPPSVDNYLMVVGDGWANLPPKGKVSKFTSCGLGFHELPCLVLISCHKVYCQILKLKRNNISRSFRSICIFNHIFFFLLRTNAKCQTPILFLSKMLRLVRFRILNRRCLQLQTIIPARITQRRCQSATTD